MEGAGGAILCVSCLTENRQGEAFCRKCGAPVGAMTNLNPVQTIQTDGFLLRKALEGRPKPVVFLGVWILHLPVLVVGVGMVIYLLINFSELADLVFILAMAGLSCFAFIVLYRITRNYFTANKSG